jgi:hypothetical protein
MGALALTAGAASAQPNVTVPGGNTSPTTGGPTVYQEREVTALTGPAQDAYYDPKGIPLGGPFRLFPSLKASVAHDDNVYRTPAAQLDDFYFNFVPTVVLDYETSVARLDAYARGDFSQYAELTQVNTTNYDFGLRGTYVASRATSLRGGVSYSEQSEPLSSPNTVGFQLAPTQYSVFNANGAVSYQPNRFTLTAGFSYDSYDYANSDLIGGGVLGNKDRNYDTVKGFVDAGYEFSPGYSTFMRFTYNDVSYERFFDRSGIHRSSDGYQADAGLRFLLGNLAKGEAYIGYVQQDYDQAQPIPLPDISGLDFGADLYWYPTNLMTVHLGASRTFQATTLFGASAGDDRGVDLQLLYSLTRQIDLNARVSYDDVLYKGTSPLREDENVRLGLGAKYKVSHYVSLDLGYTYSERTSTSPTLAYTDNLIMLGLNLQI